MYFKKLEILGFKSFADKTVLNFEPGITAIVGPNGCGKSNVFDAIRWVLGEQSVKSLRGTSMEDVIFNGTDKKAGVGFADVSLTFSNEKKMLPIEYDEVTITRRLFRSGESEYLLNKTQVRLKDILELFMGTGIGAESYSLIEQGKIDLIISSKPEERRMIFDEASGITKYKSKKREALNKLQDTENNLLRINDIIIEVKRQIGSIERQASKARRYKEEFEKLKDLEIKAAFFELNKLKSQLQDLTGQSVVLQDKETQLNAQSEELNKLIASFNSELEKLKNELEEIKARDLRFDSSIEMDKHQIELNKERFLESKERINRLGQQGQDAEKRLISQNEKIEKLSQEIAGLSDFEKNTTSLIKEKNNTLQTIALAIKQAEELIAKSRKNTLELTASHSKIKNDLTEVLTQTQQVLARKRRLEMEKTKVTSEKEALNSDLESVSEEIEAAKAKINLQNAQKQESVNSLEELQQKNKSVTGKIIGLEKEKVTLESQEEFVEDLKLQYQEMPSAQKSILLISDTPMENITGILGKVKEILPFDEKLKVLLPENVSRQDFSRMKQIVCETKFIELDSRKIAQRITEVIDEIEKLKLEEELICSQIESRNKQIEAIESQLHQEEIAFSNQETQKNNILQQANKLDGELDLLADELRESQALLDKVSAKDKELKKQNDEMEAGLKLIQNTISENLDLISLKAKEKEEASVFLAQAETEIASLKDKENSLLDNLRIFEEAKKRDEEELNTTEKEKSNIELRIGQLEKENSELEKRIGASAVQKQSLKEKFNELDRRLSDSLKRIKEEEYKRSLFQEELQKVVNHYHQIKMQEQEISFKEQSTKERFLQAYKLNLDEVTEVCLEGIDFEALSNQLAELKKKVESFGTVNLVAIEEYEELKKRFEFLNQQQQDLLSAKDQLHSTINKINRTTRQLFLDTFTKVAEEFKNYFKLLFGGGEAQLILMNPEDVLETGIEIVARPPGKKLQSISLLSGGEKALTAIALIFGVFRVKPSPFCILDEIDAALDESNVGRFAHLLKDFAEASQFIVITHNKKTIVNADVMYGITMQETGVSKIVSVKFADKASVSEPRESREAVAATA